MFTTLIVIQVLLGLGIIGLVLLQQGKGADMGAAFGAGASGSVFGSRGGGSFFSRMTGVLAAAFFVNSVLLSSPIVRDVTTPASVTQIAPVTQETEQPVVEEEIAVDVIPAPADVPALPEETIPVTPEPASNTPE